MAAIMAVINFLLLIQWQLYLSSTYAIYSHHITTVIVSVMVHVMFVAFMDNAHDKTACSSPRIHADNHFTNSAVVHKVKVY